MLGLGCLFAVMIAAARLLGTRALFSHGARHMAFIAPKWRHMGTATKALSNDECIHAFDKIKNDEITTLQRASTKDPQRGLRIDFGMFNRYAEELNAVLENAAFMGITHIPMKKDIVEGRPMEAALFHFRGFERGDSLCLFYQKAAFPFVPSPAASYVPPSERKLSYFETVMSGLSGLRVSKVHCPFYFKNIIAIDMRPAHTYSSGDGNDTHSESYRMLVIARPKGNRFVLTDNRDGVILLTSDTFDEKSGIKDGVGSLFQPEKAKRETPNPQDAYEDFVARFKGKQHMSLLKSMIMSYEGLDTRRITYLAGKAGVDPTLHLSKIENLADFYDSFMRWLRCPVESSEHLQFLQANAEDIPKDNPETPNIDTESSDASAPDKTAISYVFKHWGSSSPVYQHNRLAEESKELIDKTLERLEKVREQCIGDEQQEERLAKVNERIHNIREYEKSLLTTMKWKSPDHFDLVKIVYQQVWELGDLTGYRKKARDMPYQFNQEDTDEEEGRNLPNYRVKKVNPYKGILVIKTHPQDPDSALIIVGRNAKQNEKVTHELAQKGDIWLHTKDCPGSHVLLRRSLGSVEALQIAADIAAYYSKAKKLESAPVINTNIENVKKCPDAELGAVLVSHFETIHGRPSRGGEYVKAHRISMN